jgi:hypothetical protein
MKKLFLLMAVSAIAAIQAWAVNPFPVLSLSCTAQFNKTNYVKSSQGIATTVSESINNKLVYNVISNAVAGLTNGMATHLPANGYIAYDPYDSDRNVYSFFYVTNKTGLFYPLSGYDTNNNYYSLMELDSTDFALGSLGFGNSEGDDVNAIYSYNVNLIKETGSEKDTETALLYIHSNPSDYDDLDNPYAFSADNQNAIEVRGIFVLSISGNKASASITGTGNINMNSGINQGVVTSGKVGFN